MFSHVPKMYVFAGNNGSGKSTIRNLIVDKLGLNINIDPDALARAISPTNPERYKVSAGKEAIKIARDCIRNGRDFSVETTLAGGNVIRLIREARKNGFEINMFYIGLGEYTLNIQRVATRVKNGGHDIPAEDIVRRHVTSIENLLANLNLIDYLSVIDNSESKGEVVLQIEKGKVKYRYEFLPQWVKHIEDHITQIP